MEIETTKPVWTGLMTYLHGAGSQVFKYINDNKLLEILQTYTPTEPNDLDSLAKDLVVRNPDRVTVHELLLYSQVRDALREADLCFQEDIVKRWAEKARIARNNLASIKYMLNISEEEIQKEKNKMDGVEKEFHTKSNQVTGPKK